MKERVLNLLSLCMSVKEKGNDCVFYYTAHVLKVSIRVYIPHWKPSATDTDGNFISGTDNLKRSFDFYLDDEDAETIIAQVENYLKGLIA